MRVVEPHEFKGVKHPKKKRGRGKLYAVLVLIIASAYAASVFLVPTSGVIAQIQQIAPISGKQVNIAWPAYGQSAVGVVGYGTLGTHGEQLALPTASVAKVMTALAVLKQKPLTLGQQGPMITYDQDDVNKYNETIAMGGSNNLVALGASISEYQALQALLLPSSNNMAYTLADWAFGSEENYLKFVNNFAKSLGMNNTTFADASGFSPQTVSTAEDLTKLAVNAMDNPVIAEIAAQKSAVIPVAGTIYNVNMLLGKNGIVGIKTGNTEEAGGCFMAAAVREIGGHKIIAVSVIMGASDRYSAQRDSVPLVNSVLDGFEEKQVITKGQVLGSYNSDGVRVNAIAKTSLTGLAWQDSPITTNIHLDTLVNSKGQGNKVGTAKISFGRHSLETDILLENDMQVRQKRKLLPL